MLSDLGRYRDFLCRDRALLGPVSRLWTVSRQGVVKARRPYVATQQVCRDKMAQRVRGSVRDRRSVLAAMGMTGARAQARQGSASD